MWARASAVWARVQTLGGRRWMHWLVTGLVLVFSAAVLGGMLLNYWPTLAAYTWKLRPWPLVAAFVAYAADLLLAVFGWSRIMRRLVGAIAFREHFRIYCLTLVAGRIPGAPWHLAGRAVLYERHGISKRVTGVAAGLEMILITVSGMILGLMIWPSLAEKVNVRQIGVALLVGLGLGLSLIHPAVIKNILKRLKRNNAAANLRYGDMLALLAFYGLIWAVGGVVLYVVILAIYPLPLTALPSVMGSWGLSGAVAVLAFFSPSGLGIREVTLSLLLAMIMPAGVAVIIAIMMRLFLTGTEFMWAVVASRLSPS